MQHVWIALVSMLLCSAGCSDSNEAHEETSSDTGDSEQTDVDGGDCSRKEIETTLEAALSVIETDVDFSFYIEDGTGASFTYNRGSSTLDTPYESASTSKWITGTVVMRAVEAGYLSLDDSPQDYLTADEWAIANDDPLFGITLRHLLSFTSGVITESGCMYLPNRDFFECVRTISEENAANGETPGTSFIYGGSHLQVAGAMAVRAAGVESWQALFDTFKADTGLFHASNFDLPSLENPRLASGMTWIGHDYIDFLRAFKTGALFTDPAVQEEMITDQLKNATVVKSPALEGIDEDWHYGLGLWIECHSNPFDCDAATAVSSPGAFGAYPFIDYRLDILGIIARQGSAGTFREGYALFDAVRPSVEAWALCAIP